MKKIAILFALTFSIFLTTPCRAEGTFDIYIDSVQIDYNADTGLPFADESDRIMVPLRKTMETFGAEVTWKPQNRTVVIKKDSKILILTLGSNIIKTSDRVDIVSDTPPYIKNNRIYLPIRVVAEQLGTHIVWNGQLDTVYATTEKYRDFKGMFSYDESHKENDDINTVVISATYAGEMSPEEFKEYWLNLNEDEFKTYAYIIASEKKLEYPHKEILINFFARPQSENETNPYLGSASTFSYDATKYNPYSKN